MQFHELQNLLNARDFQNFQHRFANSKIILTNYDSSGYLMHKTLKPVSKLLSTISKDYWSWENYGSFLIVDNESDLRDVEILEFDMILEVLQHFGKYIQHLQINLANADSYEAKTISKYIGKYAAESVTEIEFDIGKGNIMKYITQPFKKVQSATFLGKIPSVDQNVLRMNESFPELRILTLSHLESNIDYLNSFLPNLVHVNILTGKKISSDHVIFNLFAANPHIRIIYMDGYKSTFLSDFTSIAPQLNSIILASQKSTIRHDKATRLSIVDKNASPNAVIMPNLKELEMYFDTEFFYKWVDFLIEHQTIKRLVLQFTHLNGDQLQGIMEILSNLEELFLVSMKEQSWRADSIIYLLEFKENLKVFAVNKIRKSDSQVLYKKFKDTWVIKPYENRLSFERK